MTNFNTIPFDPSLGVHVEYQESGVDNTTSLYNVTDLEFQEQGIVFKYAVPDGATEHRYTRFVPYGRLLVVDQTETVEV
jgi:hypothetical protein